MRLILNALFLTSVVAGNLHAQTVISNNNLGFQRPGQFGGTFGFSVWQDVGKTNVTGVDFTYNGTSISFNNINLDEGSDWYVVNPGNSFTNAAINAGQFPRIVTIGPTSYPPAFVGSGDFYLGVNTGLGYDIPEDRTVFGWVHLRRVSGVVTMIDNAMAYDSPGIIVGTTLVPEPATIAVAICTLPWCLLARRGRRN